MGRYRFEKPCPSCKGEFMKRYGCTLCDKTGLIWDQEASDRDYKIYKEVEAEKKRDNRVCVIIYGTIVLTSLIAAVLLVYFEGN